MASVIINERALEGAFDGFYDQTPFPHAVIDNFLHRNIADQLVEELEDYSLDSFNGNYQNQIEVKRTCNIWDRLSSTVYRTLAELNSPRFVSKIAELTGVDLLYADPGLHGAGVHYHPPGGKLNPHLDYSLHPKLFLERKFNLLIYLNKDWKPEWGGHFGLWNSEDDQPTSIAKEVAPVFNRAVIFDTTFNGWHGLSREVSCPPDRARQSLAVYYLKTPVIGNAGKHRPRAQFAPTEDQRNDPEVLELINRRMKINSHDASNWSRT